MSDDPDARSAALVPRRTPGELAVINTFQPTPLEQEQRDLALQKRREARETNHHKGIWTKAPHGGAYYKVVLGRLTGPAHIEWNVHGPEPARPTPSPTTALAVRDASSSWPEWVTAGYEVVKVGATTNIVGDAMSQGAVDLVKAQLTSAGAAAGVDVHWSRQHQGGAAAGHPAPAAGDATASTSTGQACSGQQDCSCEQCAVSNARVARFQTLWARLAAQGKVPQP